MQHGHARGEINFGCALAREHALKKQKPGEAGL
jgi:hypothetical protein